MYAACGGGGYPAVRGAQRRVGVGAAREGVAYRYPILIVAGALSSLLQALLLGRRSPGAGNGDFGVFWQGPVFEAVRANAGNSNQAVLDLFTAAELRAKV